METGTTGIREWLSYGYMWTGVAPGGLSNLTYSSGLTGHGWHLATDAIWMLNDINNLIELITYGFGDDYSKMDIGINSQRDIHWLGWSYFHLATIFITI